MLFFFMNESVDVKASTHVSNKQEIKICLIAELVLVSTKGRTLG